MNLAVTPALFIRLSSFYTFGEYYQCPCFTQALYLSVIQ